MHTSRLIERRTLRRAVRCVLEAAGEDTAPIEGSFGLDLDARVSVRRRVHQRNVQHDVSVDLDLGELTHAGWRNGHRQGDSLASQPLEMLLTADKQAAEGDLVLRSLANEVIGGVELVGDSTPHDAGVGLESGIVAQQIPDTAAGTPGRIHNVPSHVSGDRREYPVVAT